MSERSALSVAVAEAAQPVGAADKLPLMRRDTAETYARWFQVLSDPTRIIILNFLSRQSRPVSVTAVVAVLDVGQPTISHHLKALLDTGFVTRQRHQNKSLYAVNPNCLRRFPAAAEVVMGSAAEDSVCF